LHAINEIISLLALVVAILWFRLWQDYRHTDSKVYAKAEIPEYWIVDLKNRCVKILRNPHDGNYTSELTLTDGEVTPLAFPDIIVSVSRLLNG
jgi:Uma2 family endonuclease